MARVIVGLIGAAAWAFVYLVGQSLYSSVVDQRISGYPNDQQFRSLIVFPLVFMLFNIGLVIFAKRIPALIFVLAVAGQMMAALVWMMIIGGGI